MRKDIEGYKKPAHREGRRGRDAPGYDMPGYDAPGYDAPGYDRFLSGRCQM